jgi:hypothetical protein
LNPYFDGKSTISDGETTSYIGSEWGGGLNFPVVGGLEDSEKLSALKGQGSSTVT